MNRVLKILLFFVSILFVGLAFLVKTEAYNCTTWGMYCQAPYGSFVQGVWENFYGRCYYIDFRDEYTCDGDDTDCNGGIPYYLTQEDCLLDRDECYAGCCGSTPVEPPEPPCDNSCDDTCTLTCPDGQSTVVSGPLCRQNVSSCSYSNDCGNTCTETGDYCYLPETNLTPSAPSLIQIEVDDVTYTLSTNPSSPTVIKLPSNGAPDVRVKMPSISAPAGSRDYGYYFESDNYGVSNEWLGGTQCVGVDGEDFCKEGMWYDRSFEPSSKTAAEVLKENAEGKLIGKYYTLNVCDDTKRYSNPVVGYYAVNDNPDITDDDFEITITDQACTATNYTGMESNNPLPIRLVGRDLNDNDQIQGAVLWFSSDVSTPALVPISGAGYVGTNLVDMGVLVRRNVDGTWVNPRIYGINIGDTWRLLSGGRTLRNSSGEDILEIAELSVTQGSELVFELEVRFIPQISRNHASGIYNIKGVLLDTYMINSEVVDQSHMGTLITWGVDLEIPTVVSVSEQIITPEELILSWEFGGTTSNITDLVVNAYRRDALVNDQAEMVVPYKGFVDLEPIPSEDQIGLLTDTNSWRFTGLATPTYSSSARINTDRNEGGVIDFYLTAYDQGCNFNAGLEEADLRPWVATKGGDIYSRLSMGNAVKDISSIPESFYRIGEDFTIQGVAISEIDSGSELLSVREGFVADLLHPELGAVRATDVYDSNDQKDFWFDHFKERLLERADSLTSFSLPLNCEGEKCYMLSEGNITIPSGYDCDKQILFMSEGNITINPNVTNSGGGINGCIFVAKENIYIGNGIHQSNSGIVEYDYVDGFMIVDNTIQILEGDQEEDIADGLEVNGGLVSFGSQSIGMTSVQILRNLKLFNSINPTLVITNDVRFARLSEVFFGPEAALYKQEVGFKSF